MSEWAPKRFWKSARVTDADGAGFAVWLDQRALKTPGRSDLVLPTRTLAELVAAEWDAQADTVNPWTMPMTRMANSAIDRIAARREEVVAYVAGYGETDLLCYRASGPAALVEAQTAAWDPILDWASKAFGARLVLAEGVMPVPQDDEALGRLRDEVAAHDDFCLMGLHELVSLTGSLVLGLAADRNLFPPDRIWDLSRIDENWQIAQWGEDAEAADVASSKREHFLAAHRFSQAAR